jgi:hypothetical protein
MRYVLMICTDETYSPSRADSGFMGWVGELGDRLRHCVGPEPSEHVGGNLVAKRERENLLVARKPPDGAVDLSAGLTRDPPPLAARAADEVPPIRIEDPGENLQVPVSARSIMCIGGSYTFGQPRRPDSRMRAKSSFTRSRSRNRAPSERGANVPQVTPRKWKRALPRAKNLPSIRKRSAMRWSRLDAAPFQSRTLGVARPTKSPSTAHPPRIGSPALPRAALVSGEEKAVDGEGARAFAT